MSKQRSRQDDPQNALDLTPMIDVTFQLIIFFLVVSQITSRDSVNLSLPDGITSGDRPEAAIFTVHIAPVGDTEMPEGWGYFCYGDPQPRTREEMRSILANEAASTDPGLQRLGHGRGGISENTVFVRCDARCPAHYFASLVELISEQMIYKIQIAVRRDQ